MTPAPPLSARWLYLFVAVQCGSVALLTVEALGGFRIVLRLVPFALSLAYLVLLPPGGARYPVRAWAALGLGVMAFGLFHPEANTVLAGVAQIALSAAVWGPVFWAGRLPITPEVLRRTLLILWAFNAVSAAFGVLQVYMPGRFAPDPTFVRQLSGDATEGLKVQLDDGTEVFRPMGLSDTPGGAALAANTAIVLGIGVALGTRSLALKVAVAGGAVVAMFCLFICQVRSLLILTVLSAAFMLVLAAARGRGRQAGYIALVAAGGGAVGFAWATAIGQTAVVGRLETLFEASAGEVFYTNRGYFVEETVAHWMPEYPLGAGLGRWGMMAAYFGDPNRPDSPPLWAEIGLTGWVFDGGIPLVALGYGALALMFAFALRLALAHPDPILSTAGVTVAAMGAAAFATTLTAHLFVAQSGMIFLLVNALLYAAARHRTPTARPPVPR